MMHPRKTPLQTFCLAVLLIGAVGPFQVFTRQPLHAWEPNSQTVAAGTEPLTLNFGALNESSGLAFSYVDKNCVWSHNDSGDRARLFAFNASGKLCGRTSLRGVKADDWEDMASFDDSGPRLLVADVGDNDSQRKSVSLYIFDEPDPKRRTSVESFQHLVIRYAGGAQNCESVAVDVARRRILLLGKSPLVATMHEVPLPKRPKLNHSKSKDANTNGTATTDSSDAVMVIEIEAKPIQSVAIPLATGMDLCQKTGDLWVSNYFQAYRFANSRRMTLEERLKRIPEIVELPKLKQVEAIAVDDQGRIWVTSEGSPAKLQRVIVSP